MKKSFYLILTLSILIGATIGFLACWFLPPQTAEQGMIYVSPMFGLVLFDLATLIKLWRTKRTQPLSSDLQKEWYSKICGLMLKASAILAIVYMTFFHS